ncbi:MAG: transglutaminase domain-containing protein [Nitrospirota bacterium]
MNWLHTRTFKVISFAVLFFFTWTSGGLFQAAYAIKDSSESGVQSSELKKEKPEEKLKKALDEIEQIVQKVQAVQTDKEREDEKQKLKTKKTEIGNIDVEIKKQFKETEDKIKNLPDEIVQRHKDFVKKYEENLKEFKTNLDDIDKAKTKEEKEEAHKKVKEFFEKVKPPKNRTPLDPNNLPHRTAEPERIEPRTQPEQFLEELRAEASPTLAKGGKRGFDKSILVASASDSLNGILSDSSKYAYKSVIPVETGIQGSGYPIETFGYDKESSSSTAFDFDSSNSQLLTPNLLLALATPPTDADLSETIEVQFTPEITAKAEELQHNPVKIYNWVRNNFEYEPYYGSLKGAQQTLLEMVGNDFDQASLLIALLRASNIPARYVYGTAEIPIEKLMNWAGGVTDPNTAATILATAGIPGKLLTEGGQIKYAQMEHVWIEAYVPYGNYRGAMRDDSIKTWIPLDPSFKQYEYKRGMDLYSAMGINGEQYIMDYITDMSPSPIPAELQELFPDYTISPYQFYSKRLLNYVDTNFPDSTIEDIIGDETVALTKAIIKKEYPYLLGSLPYKVITKGATYSSIPDNQRHRISFSIKNALTYETVLSYSVTLPEIAGKRITLSYIPATSTDETLVVKYGTLLNVPPYLIKVKPVIKANGVIIATGSSDGLGYNQMYYMTFKMPNKKTDTVTNTVTAGDYSAIAIQYYKTSLDVVGEKMQTLQNNSSSTDLDDLLGQMLYNIGISYMHHLNFEEELYAKNFQMIITKEPSEAIVTSQAITEWLWGTPYKVTEGGVGIDVDRNIYASFSLDGNQQRKKDFMIVAGIGSSAWEDMILQSFFNIPSVSASRLLKTANQQGIPIYTIDSSNINTMMPQLQVAAEVISEIRNAVNAGKKVIISKTNVQYNDWNGVGYIVLNPNTGAGAYMISGGLAGAEPSKLDKLSDRELNDLYARICDQKRWIIAQTAGGLIDTPYVWGGKFPHQEGGIDCSGFVGYCYFQAGIISLFNQPARSQYNITKPTDVPLYVDLVFWKGTYDSNNDCYKNEKDVSHVGIGIWPPYNIVIHASATFKKVVLAFLSEMPGMLTEEKVISIKDSCKVPKGVTVDINNGECPYIKGCYNWQSTGINFMSYAGYRYASEFDSCQFDTSR